MKIGLLSNSLSPELPQALDMVAQLGIAGIEVQYSDAHAPRVQEPGHGRWLAEQAQQRGLTIAGICLGTLCHKHAFIDAPEAIPAAKELVAAACAVAKDAGAPTVLIPFFGENAIELEAELERAIEFLGDVLETAEQAEVVLGVESLMNFNQCRYLLGQFNSPSLAIYQDTGNALARKLDLPTGLRDLGKENLAGIHFKDVKMSAPPKYDVALGEGDVQFRAVLSSLRAIGYDGWIVLETPPGSDPLASAKANVKFTKDLLARSVE